MLITRGPFTRPWPDEEIDALETRIREQADKIAALEAQLAQAQVVHSRNDDEAMENARRFLVDDVPPQDDAENDDLIIVGTWCVFSRNAFRGLIWREHPRGNLLGYTWRLYFDGAPGGYVELGGQEGELVFRALKEGGNGQR